MSKKEYGSPIRSLSDKYFELLLITMVLAGSLVIHNLVSTKQLVLHFYYLPVIIAAHYFGRKLAGMTALLAFLLVVAFAWLDPVAYMEGTNSTLILTMTLCVWGAFLGLNAILIGTLCDQRASHIRELREAHTGIIEILSKYLQAADQYTKSHSMRVADLSEEIAKEMKLRPDEIENIRAGSLLHDIGKVEVSTRLIKKAADLNEAEREEMDAHTFQGAELVGSLGTIMEGAIPIIRHHHDHYSAGSKAEGKHGKDIPLGARIVAVADAYDAIVTDRPYRRGRTPQEAVAVIQDCAGKQFDPQVVRAFERVTITRVDESEDSASSPAADKGIIGQSSNHAADPALNVEIPLPEGEVEAS